MSFAIKRCFDACNDMLYYDDSITKYDTSDARIASNARKLLNKMMVEFCGEWDLAPMVLIYLFVQSNTGRGVGTKNRGFVFSHHDLSFGSDTEHELGCYIELYFVFIRLAN